jgi:hypothetical protein
VTDEDGDTPLYTVESLEVAKWLVEHGATVDRMNSEGISVRIIFIPSERTLIPIGPADRTSS